ncbi:MAG TPA: xanthine dehydrogenase family protein molybdopterin-binding subunit, partial [bacterium]|nr:xanthine dehydrogenase family protein molybdopterin-binding subunit [bacterium]
MSVDITAGTVATRVVGKATKRVEGMEKVTGTARYTEDLSLPGMLSARLVLSPHPHARVVRIPAAGAIQVPGVVAVLTASDLPAGVTHKVMADKETRYTGQPVALVLAETEAAAADAADRLAAEVEYAILPAVLTPSEALRAGAPLVADEMEENAEAAGHATVSAGAVTETLPRNVANRYHFTRGDVAQGFRDAEVVTER